MPRVDGRRRLLAHNADAGPEAPGRAIETASLEALNRFLLRRRTEKRWRRGPDEAN